MTTNLEPGRGGESSTRSSAPAAPLSPEGLRIEDLWVRFGATTAVAGVNLTVGPGEIVGLMGHNGAGKSTVLNVATGAVRPTEGSVYIDGTPLPTHGGPGQVAAMGITVIHQEPALVPNLSIYDNLFLARPRAGSEKDRRASAQEAMAELASDLDLDQPVSSLRLGERQLVDLARGMLSGDIRALFLDEPCAGLGLAETTLLHSHIREVAHKGAAVIYVSHRLPDVLDVCDRIVVLREGAVVLDEPRKGYTAKTLARALAPEVDSGTRSEHAAIGAESLAVDVADNSLRFSSGEIVGLFGVAGGPQFDLLDSLMGEGAEVAATLHGAPYHAKNPDEAIRKRVHLVPGDREVDGLLPNLSGMDNVFLPWLSKFLDKGAISQKYVAATYAEIREQFNIFGPDGNASIGSFSGGNRQKHLLARWMSVVRPDVLLLAQPTQGVDESAKADIRRAVRGLADQGVTVVVASAETDEIASLCDRVVVITDDRAVELPQSSQIEEDMLEVLFHSHEESAHDDQQ